MFKIIRKAIVSPIVKNLFIYSFSSLLLRGISLFTAPITMGILSPAEYGLLALANSFISVITLFLGLGLRQAFSLEFFHLNTVQQKEMMNDIILVYLMCTTSIYAILFCAYHTINRLVFASHATRTLVYTSLSICFIYFFVELFYQVLQYQAQAKKLACIQAAIAVTTICLQLVFLCFFKLGITSLLLAQAIGMCIATCIGLKTYIKKNCLAYVNIRRSYYASHHYLKLGAPFIPTVLFSWILSSGDRWVLAHMGTIHDVGIYSVADAFGQLFHLLVLYPMSCAYVPYILRSYKEQERDIMHVEQWNQKVMHYSMIGFFVIITVGYIVCKPILYYLLPASYYEAVDYIWFILIGSVFFMGTYFANCLIQHHKKRCFLGLVLLLPATLNIILNCILIPYYRIYGCVCATLVAYISYFALTVWYNKKISTTDAPTALEHIL